MKYVVGIVPPAALERVQSALAAAEIHRLTVSEVEVVRPSEEVPPGGWTRGIRVEIAVNDDFLAPALAAFEAARDGQRAGATWIGGTATSSFPIEVSVLPLDDAIRIRTGERGPEAI